MVKISANNTIEKLANRLAARENAFAFAPAMAMAA